MVLSRSVRNVGRVFARRVRLGELASVRTAVRTRNGAPMKARASSRTPNLLDVAEGFLDFFAGDFLGVALEGFGD